jgi:hypothetical protein
MMDGAVAATADPELEPIQLICGGSVQRMTEAGRNYIHMVKLKFNVRGTTRVMDALLCLDYPNDSYPTKLYLAENLGLGLNWNENGFILGRQWFSWSWKDVGRNQKPLAILAGHLEAFK